MVVQFKRRLLAAANLSMFKDSKTRFFPHSLEVPRTRNSSQADCNVNTHAWLRPNIGHVHQNTLAIASDAVSDAKKVSNNHPYRTVGVIVRYQISYFSSRS